MLAVCFCIYYLIAVIILILCICFSEFYIIVCYFFFQAEDGIRDKLVTGVQTCALPISTRTGSSRPVGSGRGGPWPSRTAEEGSVGTHEARNRQLVERYWDAHFRRDWTAMRSEEHTSELQSLAYLVCRLLLEKKKKKTSCLAHLVKIENRQPKCLQ